MELSKPPGRSRGSTGFDLGCRSDGGREQSIDAEICARRRRRRGSLRDRPRLGIRGMGGDRERSSAVDAREEVVIVLTGPTAQRMRRVIKLALKPRVREPLDNPGVKS